MCFILAVFLLRRCNVNKLFSVDLSKINYKEIAEWIIECRNHIKSETYDNKEDYFIDLEAFCDEWEKHAEANSKIYKSDKYKKALVYISFREMISFHFDYGNGKEEINPFLHNFNASIFASDKIEKELTQQFNRYYDKLLKIFEQDTPTDNYKIALHEIVLNQRFNELKVYTRVFVNNKWLKEASFESFLSRCEKIREYEIEFKERDTKNSYVEALKEYGITKTVYNEFISNNKCEQEFGKKMFINLAFALALPFTLADKLLTYNGYSLKGSNRFFDIICSKALFVGFSREITIDLINKKNLELSKAHKTYKGIPNLNINRK